MDVVCEVTRSAARACATGAPTGLAAAERNRIYLVAAPRHGAGSQTAVHSISSRQVALAALEALVERSPEPSRALQVIAGYFRVTAALMTISWLTMFGAALYGFKPFAAILHWPVVRYVGLPLTVAMWYHVGQLLSARRREGGFWAGATLLLPLVTRLVSHPARGVSLDLATSAVGLLLIAVVWKELE